MATVPTFGMEHRWTDKDRGHTAEQAVDWFVALNWEDPRQWEWVDREAGDFRLKGGSRFYRVLSGTAGWEVHRHFERPQSDR
jgi:hypothetical protein